MSIFARFGLTLMLILSSVIVPTDKAKSQDLQQVFDAMRNPVLDTSATFRVDSLTLGHKDVTLTFLTGRLAFFEPVVIDDEEMAWGAYFEGSGRLKFMPAVDIEKEQLNRFFRTDSLDRSFDRVLLMFTPEIHAAIKDSVTASDSLFNADQVQQVRKSMDDLTVNDHRGFIFELLGNMVHPAQHPFLLASLVPDKGEPVVYIFNSAEREEVRFLKSNDSPVGRSLEVVCQYSQYIDAAYVNINGLNKERVFVQSYDIEATTDSATGFSATVETILDVKMTPTRMIQMSLHSDLVIDSVVDSTGQGVAFSRYGLSADGQRPVYLFFNRSLNAGEQVSLRFFYHGRVIEYADGVHFATSGVNWYPRYRYGQRSLFSLNLKTRSKYSLIAAGNLITENRVEDTLFTRWKVVPPTTDVSFNLGRLRKRSYELDDIAPVDVYFSANPINNPNLDAVDSVLLERGVTRDEVTDDIINAMRVYGGLFGPYPLRQLSAGEVSMPNEHVVPGFLQVTSGTWTNVADPDVDRLSRAHELAHQWWGVGVGYETYHDRWICEGLADYSAIMYLQVVAGNEKFLDRIREYRTEVYAARDYLYGSGEEFGPVVLGNRTGPSATGKDYNLIVYKKAALIIHMLRNLLIDLRTMQEDRFKGLLRDLYSTYRGDRINTQSFRRLVEKHTAVDMGWFFNQFVYRTELPTYEFTYDLERDSSGTYTAYCRVITTGVGEDFQMYVPLEIEIDTDNKAYVRILINGPDYEFSLPDLPRRPRYLRLNPFESVLARVRQ